MLRTNYEKYKAKQRHLISSVWDQRILERCPGGKLFHRVVARSQTPGHKARQHFCKTHWRLCRAQTSAPISSTHWIPLISNFCLFVLQYPHFPWKTHGAFLWLISVVGSPITSQCYLVLSKHLIEPCSHHYQFPMEWGQVDGEGQMHPLLDRVILDQIPSNSILFLSPYFDACHFVIPMNRHEKYLL